MTKKYALLSVYDKTGIVEFAKKLSELDWKIIASGGTAKAISEAGIEVKDVASLVGGKAILGHRVVTLSREVHAGLLATESKEDIAELDELEIPRIDLVCVDMYPLKEEIENPKATLESVIEKTDIGGPTMLRAAAKGNRIVMCEASDREWVSEWIAKGMPDKEKISRQLSAKAEFVSADYILSSAKYLGEGTYDGFIGTQTRELCYGENRRQETSALYSTSESSGDPLALDKFILLVGKDPSFINMTDVHRLIETTTRIGAGWEVNFGAVPLLGAAVKHGNACGAGVGETPQDVIEKVVSGDPEAISGGIVLFNFEVDADAAKALRTHKMPEGQTRILDSVIAPSFTDEAVELLSRKTGKCRLFTNTALEKNGLGKSSVDVTKRFRQVRGGFLTQDGDPFVLKLKDEWNEHINNQQKRDAVLSWAIGSTANSNTIVLTKNDMLIGSGTGQRSRVMACKVALLYTETYGHNITDAVAYSDSFFPFPDGPEVLANAGVTIILTTSGSIRDEEVAQASEKAGAKLLTIPDTEARGFYGH